jgi:uncharacterized protein
MLPRHIDPRKFAQQGVSIHGEVELNALNRLCPLLVTDQGKVHADLNFGIDEQGIRCLKGTINAQLMMACQRCLGDALQVLDATLHLGMIWSDDDAERLPKSFDPWIVDEGVTDIYQVIEDELMLSLPIVAYHSHPCVEQTLFSVGDDKQESGTSAQKSNPFQVLEQLKGSLKNASDTDKIDK